MLTIKLNFLRVTYVVIFLSFSVNAQVGIGTTAPKSRLDITASNPDNPMPTDGLLVPRVNKFPSRLPGEDQEGMLFYLTKTDGDNSPGFYFWKGNLSKWMPFAKRTSTSEPQWAEGTSRDGSKFIYAISARNEGNALEVHNNGNIRIDKLRKRRNPSLTYPASVVASEDGTLQVSNVNNGASFHRKIKVVTADYDQNNRSYNQNYILPLEHYDNDVSIFILRKSKSYVQALVHFAGISGGVDGRVITIMNTEKQFRFQFTPENYSTASKNRFNIRQNINMEAEGYHSATFIYDGSSSRWLLLNKS